MLEQRAGIWASLQSPSLRINTTVTKWQYNTMQYNAIQCNTMQINAILTIQPWQSGSSLQEALKDPPQLPRGLDVFEVMVGLRRVQFGQYTEIYIIQLGSVWPSALALVKLKGFAATALFFPLFAFFLFFTSVSYTHLTLPTTPYV